MRNNFMKITAAIIAAAMTCMMMTGCGSSLMTKEYMNESIYEDEMTGAPYFTDGVYVNYPMYDKDANNDIFFAFDNAQGGRTVDLAQGGAGNAFELEQTEGSVVFTFGDELKSQRVFTVTAVGDGYVAGTFGGGNEIVFERIGGVNTNDFLAEYSADDGGCYAAVCAADKEDLIMIANAK